MKKTYLIFGVLLAAIVVVVGVFALFSLKNNSGVVIPGVSDDLQDISPEKYAYVPPSDQTGTANGGIVTQNGTNGETSSQVGKPSITSSSDTSEEVAQEDVGPKECRIMGCSKQFCSDVEDEVVLACEWKQEFECVRNSKCERQADGKCGWTETPAYKGCLIGLGLLQEDEE